MARCLLAFLPATGEGSGDLPQLLPSAPSLLIEQAHGSQCHTVDSPLLPSKRFHLLVLQLHLRPVKYTAYTYAAYTCVST